MLHPEIHAYIALMIFLLLIFLLRLSTPFWHAHNTHAVYYTWEIESACIVIITYA